MELAILDDISSDRKNLQRMISKYIAAEKICCDILLYDSSEELLRAMPGHSFDFVFLDIKMPGMSGMELAHKIREINKQLPIVFITSEMEFALEGYEVQAADYILKPYSSERVFRVLDRILKSRIMPQYIEIKENRVIKRILVDEIIFAETRKHYIEIHTQTNIHRCYMTFEELLQILPKQLRFQNCYRGIIVNFDKVKQFQEQNLILENGEFVPVSRSKRAEMRKAYADYAFEKTRKGVFQ